MNPLALTKEDVIIALSRTTLAQRLAYRTAHIADCGAIRLELAVKQAFEVSRVVAARRNG